ncbi:MAG: trypsin-like serine protease [Gemmatimonadales bacterium]
MNQISLLLFLFFPFLALPIVRRADRDDAAYRALAAKYPELVSLARRGDGTLIGRQWVLTAAHVARGAAMSPSGVRSVRVGGADYEISEVFVHPEWTEMGPHDIGLIHLAKPVEGIRPAQLYRARDEKGQVAVLLGHGKSGDGAKRGLMEDGIARGATSKVDSADAAWLYFSFDAPPGGTWLEGAPGPGDSGGPALLERSGKVLVAGISSAGYDGRSGPGTYGAVDVFTRVSTHVAWIDSVMTANVKR